MPIHVLKAEKDKEGKWDFRLVVAWADEYVRGRDYAVLVTDEGEVVLEPRKSTKPLDYGYVFLGEAEAARSLAKELAHRYALPLLEIRSLRWDLEKSPLVKTPIE
jgi:hypothetical protein